MPSSISFEKTFLQAGQTLRRSLSSVRLGVLHISRMARPKIDMAPKEITEFFQFPVPAAQNGVANYVVVANRGCPSSERQFLDALLISVKPHLNLEKPCHYRTGTCFPEGRGIRESLSKCLEVG